MVGLLKVERAGLFEKTFSDVLDYCKNRATPEPGSIGIQNATNTIAACACSILNEG
jgi:hypothetical protein